MTSGRSSTEQCKTCNAPAAVRDLIERLRGAAGLSVRDTATAIKALRDYDISSPSVSRHDPHFDKTRVDPSEAASDLNPEDITVKSVSDYKLRLYWKWHKDEVPSDSEARAWMKLRSEIQDSETEAERMKLLRSMFVPPPKALPATIDAEFSVVDG